MDIINILMQLIAQDILTGYFLFTIVSVMLSFVISNKLILSKLDEASAKVVIFSGIIYFLTWMVGIGIMLNDSDSEIRSICLNRMFGSRWYGYWLHPTVWVLASQILWIKKIRRSKILRLVVGLLLFVSFEKYVIIVTSLEREYYPAVWTYSLSFGILVALASKLVFFTILTGIYYLIHERLKKTFYNIQSWFVAESKN